MTTYQRYLTAFSCSATGAVAQPDQHEAPEQDSAAEAIGIVDGLRFRRGDENSGPATKETVVGRIAELTGAPTVS